MKPISRRRFLGAVAGSAALAALPRAVFGQASAAAPRRPNVLFIMSDDMRVELGCYASMFRARTPNLDALAAAGVRFDRNYCQFPLCNPSRSSMLTGRPPTRTGVLGNQTAFRDLHPDWVSLPQLFKENGYVSLRNGKIFHNGIDDPKAWVEAAEMDEGDGGGGHQADPARDALPSQTTRATAPAADLSRAAYSGPHRGSGRPAKATAIITRADRTIAHLRRYRDQPFFLGCGFVKPHSPPTAPRRFLDLYDPQK